MSAEGICHRNAKKCPRSECSKTVATTTDWGAPMEALTVTPSFGKDGPIFVDSQSLSKQQRFDRERIPERVVHAKGGAAFGKFRCTTNLLHDITDMGIFRRGKSTDVAVRFSTVAGELGSADTVRDPRGFAVKFYGDEGNWDLVGNNTPVFFIRDPALFPLFIHSQKRGPDGLRSVTMRWDFWSQRPESLMQLVFMFTSRGIPRDFRHMDGFSSHTFIFHKTYSNGNVKHTAVKFRWVTQQGISGLSSRKAGRIAGNDPDYSIRDLRDSINSKQYPVWNLYVQLLPLPDDNFKWNINDLTKIWPTTEVQEQLVGTMTLNINPKNSFVQVEQLAFDPGNLVQGIGPSNDRMLQMRMLTYRDTQLHRVGTNFMQLDVNKPKKVPVNFDINGDMDNRPVDTPTYFPNSYCPYATSVTSSSKLPTNLPYPDTTTEKLDYYDTADEDNYTQPRQLYLTMPIDVRNDLAYNFAQDLIGVIEENKSISKQVVERTLCQFKNVSSDLYKRVKHYMRGESPNFDGPCVLKDTGYEFMLP